MSFINLFKSISNFQFPYALDDKAIYETALWQVFNGTRKSDSLPVTIFKANRSQQNEALIMNAIHKSKILKIPGLCHVLETFDSDPQSTFIITERVRPFPWDDPTRLQKNKEALQVGIVQILTTLKFLNDFVLGTIGKESIFIDSKGQSLLFGLELCTKKADVNPNTFVSNLHIFNRYMGIQNVSEDPKKIDSIQLGSLICDLFGGTSKIPKDWQSPVHCLAQARTTIGNFIDRLQITNSWLSNPLISVYQQLKELHIKGPEEKLAVMSNLQTSFFEKRSLYHNLTPGFVEGLIIPEISNVINWLIASQNNSASALSRIIPLLAIFLDLTVDKQYFPESSKQIIYDCFALPDRQVRFLLLIYLPKVSKHLEKSEISNKIYPRFIQGLADSDPTLRLQTLKSVPIIVPNITERQLNNELLRYLAKTQVDSDVEIRTWTVIIITRISTLLSTGSSSSILATAFTKSLKDPVIKPRLAALYGLKKSINLFDVATIANKILTVIAPGLLDKDPLVRAKAKDLFQKYLHKLESEAKSLQDSIENGNRSEDVDFDEYGKEEETNDEELVNQFMATVMISPAPEGKNIESNTPKGADNDTWDNFENINGNNEDDIWTETSATMGGKIEKKSILNGTPVKIEKSWNSELIDDGDLDVSSWGDYNAWDEAEIQVDKPHKPIKTEVKKASILTGKKPSQGILTPRSSSSHSRTATPSIGARAKNKPTSKLKNQVEVDFNDNNVDDEAWDAAW